MYLEIGIGLFALATPWLFTGLTDVFVWIHRHLHTDLVTTNIIKFILSFIVLLIPTTLMGATMPVISKFFVYRLDKMGSRVGLIYGSNVLGSVLGCFLAGFILISAFGKQQTIYYVALLNIAIGFATLYLNKFGKIFQNVEQLYQVAQQSVSGTVHALSRENTKSSKNNCYGKVKIS